MNTILPRATPESVGIPSAAVTALVDELERTAHHVHSLVIVRHGSVVADGWWAPNRREYPQTLFSLTKSFTSTAIGMAIAEGRFGLDDPVASFFPDKLPAHPDPLLAAMTVRHLLTMSAGHSDKKIGGVLRFHASDWVRTFLALPIEDEPGSRFVYSSAASHMLSAIIQATSGQPLIEYLRSRLFDPLGFGEVEWERDPQGINTGGFGLRVRTEEIAAFGQLYLQEGEWHGRRLVDPAWVTMATSRQIDTPPDEPDWSLGYGFQFWRSRHGFRADGAFGQFCLVVPESDLVVVYTSGIDKASRILDSTWSVLMPALRPAALPEEPAAHDAMQQRLNGLRYDPNPGAGTDPLEAELDGATFACDPNRYHLEALRFEFGADFGSIEVTRSDRPPARLEFGRGKWHAGRSDMLPEWSGVPLFASASWPRPGELEIDVNTPSTPFRYRLEFKFDGDRLRLSSRVNVSFGLTSLGTVVATRVR
jgi:CubicO group peptidase (beta-lactamase class C family)